MMVEIISGKSAYELERAVEQFLNNCVSEIYTVSYSTNAYIAGYTLEHEYSAMIVYKRG